MKTALLACLFASPAFAQAPPSNGPSMPSQPSDDPAPSGPSNGPSAPTGPTQPVKTRKIRKKPARTYRRKPTTKRRYRAKPRYDDPDTGLHFYLGLGVGALSATSTANGAEADISGNGVGFTAALGYNFGGITLGVAAMGASVSEFTLEVSSVQADGKDLAMITLGGYVDMGPPEGMHLQLIGGLSQFETADSPDPATGYGGSAGLGYRTRIEDEVGVGVLAYVQMTSTTFEATGTSSTTDTLSIFPALQLALTWN